MLIVAISTLNMACFFVGAKVGQKVDKGEPIKMPNLNPVEHYHRSQEKKEQSKAAKRREAVLRNIERYNGTPYGQEDIPR